MENSIYLCKGILESTRIHQNFVRIREKLTVHLVFLVYGSSTDLPETGVVKEEVFL